VWERRTLSLQSDGTVLAKQDMKWSDGQVSRGTWKVKGKVKDWPGTGAKVGLLARRVMEREPGGKEVLESQAVRVAAVRESWERAGFEVKAGVGA
jgi:hypothetical protein